MKPELADALERYGREAGARRRLRALRRADSPLAERLEVARRLTAAGDPRAAALWLLAARREHSDDAGFAYRLANALRLAGRERAARRLLEQLTREYPAWAEPAQSLAWLHRHAGRAESAAATIERWARAHGASPRVVGGAVAFLREMGLDARAQSLLAAVPAGRSDSGLLLERAGLLMRLGRFDEAETRLREALALTPAHTEPRVRLAYLRRWTEGDAAVPLALLSEQLARPDLEREERAALLFAQAKIDDDIGRYAEAFAAAEQGNALRAQTARFDRTAWRAFERTLYETFSTEFLRRFGASARSREAPVFIVGMPRSGTTLLERRLAGHPALAAAGELELIDRLAAELAGQGDYPRALARAQQEDFDRAAEAWRAGLPAALAAQRRIIDKNPLNFLHVGLIAALFARARVILCRRDPLDTALSVYLQNFAHPRNDYAYRTEDIAWMFGLFVRLSDFWLGQLPGRIHTVHYERLVAEPEIELRRATEFLGLEWDAACLRGDGDAGSIATASLWQARQPIYAGSVGRARRYAQWLGPLRDALLREGVAVSG